MTNDENLNQGHGHVTPRADGYKARCGGPGLCVVCRAEKARIATESAPAAGAASIDTEKLAEEFGLWSEQREKFVAHVAQQREAGRQEMREVVAYEQRHAAALEIALADEKDRADRAEAALAQRAAGVVDLSSLKRYSPTYDESRGADGEDRWGVMEDAEEGEYVKLTDVRALLASAPAAPVGDGDERTKALEEAAQICDNWRHQNSNYAGYCADAIRAALTQQKGN